MGSISLDKKWDTVVLVLLDEGYEPVSILEANRRKLRAALKRPGSKARNERGQLSIGQFRALSAELWKAEPTLDRRINARLGGDNASGRRAETEVRTPPGGSLRP